MRWLVICLLTLSPFLAHSQDLHGEVETRIEHGLHYLAGQQEEDGSWASLRYPDNTGIAALAVLAFLATGHMPDDGNYGAIVRRGLDYILDTSEAGKLLVSSSSHGPMYEHALCTLLLAEVWGMVRVPDLNEHLENAVQQIVRGQNASGGWRYRPGSRDAALSVTSAQVLALRAAQNAGIRVPQSTIERAVRYLNTCSVENGGFTYTPGDIPTFTRTAMGALALHLCGESHAVRATPATQYLLDYPSADKAYPYYGYYHATQLFFQMGGAEWEQWYVRISNWLNRQQNADGSWTGEIDKTYGTALAILTLAIPYQYLPIHQRWSPTP